LLLLIIVAVPAFYLLSTLALYQQLGSSTSGDSLRLKQGLRWEFERRDDLIGGQPFGELLSYQMVDSRIVGKRGDQEAFLSLNLRGQPLDAEIFSRLRARIRVDRVARFAVYHRETISGPILSTEELMLEPGWQTVDLDLDSLPWTAEAVEDGLVVGAPYPSRWGGASGTLAVLRVHPASARDVTFEVEWIEMLPDPALAERAVIPLSLLDQGAPSAPIVTLPWQGQTPEAILSLRDRLRVDHPSSSLLFSGQNQTPPLSPVSSRPLLAVLIAVVALVLAVPWWFAATPGRAALALLGLIISAGWLLTTTWSLANQLPLAAVGAVVLMVIWRRAELPGLLGDRLAWRDAVGIVLVAGLPAILQMFFGDSTMDGVSLTGRLLRYLPWAMIQQSILCLVLMGLIQHCWRHQDRSMATAAALFGLIHFPNFSLMIATLVLAWICLAHYRRHRALAPLVIIHALLGSLYLEMMTPVVLRSGLIGTLFFS
jgi:hypothetical protein